MKRILLAFVTVCLAFFTNAQATENFHSFEAETILGDIISMSQYAGKKLLVVNTASFCAYTPQFEELEALDTDYEAYNFEVIGFPCNNFGNQDPGTNEEILEFCTATYGVTFQMMARVEITSVDTCEIYKWLQLEERNGVEDANVTWNFHKFCIDEYGNWVMHFPHQTHPDNQEIIDWIMSETPINVAEANTSASFSVRSNTIGNYLTVKLNENWNGQGIINLYSVDGKLIDQIHSGFLNSKSEYRFDTSSMPSGIFVVRAMAGDVVHSEKVCIVK